ncbi:MAG: hypothetical protein U0105_23510 [Candidatus Obscuribacterales bacterium]
MLIDVDHQHDREGDRYWVSDTAKVSWGGTEEEVESRNAEHDASIDGPAHKAHWHQNCT